MNEAMTHEDQIRHILDLAAAYRLAERPQAALSKLESSLRAYVQAREDAAQTPQPAQAGAGEARPAQAKAWRVKLAGDKWILVENEKFAKAIAQSGNLEIEALCVCQPAQAGAVEAVTLTEEQERQHFEAYVVSQGQEPVLGAIKSDGPYFYERHNEQWRAWAARAILATASPVDMVLFCPACGKQHIDAPMTDKQYTERLHESSWWESGGAKPERWTNPPHRSHLCHGCGHIWRPADVPTSGVQVVRTKGKGDSDLATPDEARQKSYDEGYSDGYGAGVASTGCAP